MRSRFLAYLKDLKPAREALIAYLYEHPETVLEEGEEVPSADASAPGTLPPTWGESCWRK